MHYDVHRGYMVCLRPVRVAVAPVPSDVHECIVYIHILPPQATLLAEKHGLKVCIIDPNLEKRWIPNYGVWVEEWEALDKDLQVQYGST